MLNGICRNLKIPKYMTTKQRDKDFTCTYQPQTKCGHTDKNEQMHFTKKIKSKTKK